MYIINIWKSCHESLYNKNNEFYLESIKNLGFNSIALWGFYDEKFIEIAKNFGLYIYSLIPTVIDESDLEKFELSSTIDGDSIKQISLNGSKEWSENCINIINNNDLVDEWIITDRKWYWMVMPSSNELWIKFPFHGEKDLEILLKNGINLPYCADFKQFGEEWYNKFQNKFYELYLSRFDIILEYCSLNNIKTSIPLVFHKSIRESCCNMGSCNVLENYISKYKPNIFALNATMNSKKWFIKMKNKYNVKLYGGTEDLTGLVNNKNGRKLLKYGFDGTISNEHQLTNNSNPKWDDIISEMKFIKENYNEQ